MNEEPIEGILPRVTRERTNSGGDVRGSSSGKRTTLNSLSQSSGEGKIHSRYLKASTGSCHDLCKYGRKNPFESNGRCPTFPRFSGSSASSEKVQNRVNGPSLAERQKRSSLKQKAASHSEIGSTVNLILESEIIKKNTAPREKNKSSELPKIKCNIPSFPNKVESLEEFETIKQSTLGNLGLCDDTESTSQKTCALLKKTEVSRNSQGTYKRAPSNQKTHVSLKPALVEQIQSAKKSYTPSKHKKEQKVPSPIIKTTISGKPTNSKQEPPSPASGFEVSARSAISGKSGITLPKSESRQKPGTGLSGGNTVSKPHGNKNLKSPSRALSPQPSIDHGSKSASVTKHVREIQEQSKSSSCPASPPSPLSSPLSSSPSVSDTEEEEHQDSDFVFSEACDSISRDGGEGKNTAATTEDKKSQRKVARTHSENKDQTPYKLKFRRGKIINPQSDISVMRRLKFRRGRRVGDIQTGNGDTGDLSFKMEEFCGDMNLPDAQAQAVKLRHQDLQDKKDRQGLLNHVIEETATKLVESRKSKVKALVGAFETVISLHETRPSASV